MNSLEMKEELKFLANKNNVTISQLKEIVYLVFKFVRSVIKSADRTKGYYPSVRVRWIGIFYVTDARKRREAEKLEKDDR